MIQGEEREKRDSRNGGYPERKARRRRRGDAPPLRRPWAAGREERRVKGEGSRSRSICLLADLEEGAGGGGELLRRHLLLLRPLLL